MEPRSWYPVQHKRTVKSRVSSESKHLRRLVCYPNLITTDKAVIAPRACDKRRLHAWMLRITRAASWWWCCCCCCMRFRRYRRWWAWWWQRKDELGCFKVGLFHAAEDTSSQTIFEDFSVRRSGAIVGMQWLEKAKDGIGSGCTVIIIILRPALLALSSARMTGTAQITHI